MTRADGEPPRVLIAIPTYRRAAVLTTLVSALLSRDDVATAAADVLVVDNDPERSAAAVAESFGDRVRYAAEPTPGIAATRERALSEAGSHDVVVMLDDDVAPGDRWLAPLLETWRTTDATVVVGFVQYIWPDDAPEWIARGGFMRRVRRPTGTSLQSLSTGNVLIDVERARSLDAHFDVSIGLEGGEDTRFGITVLDRGGRIVACAESVALDRVPLARCTKEFVRRRTIDHGMTRARLLLPAPSSRAARIRLAAVSFAKAATAGVLTPALRLVSSPSKWADMRRRRWFSTGVLLGALGRTGTEYSRPISSAKS